MGQSVLVSACVFNKILKAQPVKNQEFPKYQTLQKPTYQIDSLRKEIFKKEKFT